MLELSWLREQVANRAARVELEDELSRRLDSAMRLGIGRRDLFKLALTASALAPLATHASHRPGLVVQRLGRAVSISSARGRRWTIDPDRFDGTPRVRLEQHDAAFELSLLDAMLPATRLRCDFRLTGRQRHGNWSADFEFMEWGGRASMSLDEWIDGSANALARVRLPASDAGCQGFSVRLGGDATLRFSSDWSFGFQGDRIAELAVNGKGFECSDVTVDLPPLDARSLLQHPTHRRLIATFSGSGMASLQPSVGLASLTCSTDASLLAEFVRTRDGRVVVASLWSSDASEADVTIRVGEHVAETVNLPVESYRLVQLHNGAQSSAALFAGVKPGEHWSDAADMSVAVVAEPGATVSATSEVDPRHTCACESASARLARFVIPFVGADSACFTRRQADGERVDDSVEFKDHFSFFRGEPIDLDEFSLKVSRTTDSFLGVFRFRNIQLQSLRGHWCLSKKKSCTDDAIIEFELPSQHLNEEALFSASRPGLSKVSDEVLCGPFNKDDARVVTLIGMYAFDAWAKPSEKPFYQVIRDLLIRLIARLIPAEQPPRTEFLRSIDIHGVKLPSGFSRYLTQEYASLLLALAKGADPANPDRAYRDLLAAADKIPELNQGFAGWSPLAIDANSTRLLFKAVFSKAEVPLHLDTLMAWSQPGAPVDSTGLHIEPLLSKRAVPAHTSLDKQKMLRRFNGDPIYGLHEAAPSKRARDGCVSAHGLDVATALEMPYRLVVTPVNRSADESPGSAEESFWHGDPAPQSVWGAFVSLWHVRGGRSGGPPIAMRALYSPDFRKEGFFDPPRANARGMRASLDAHDRHNLVALSGGFGEEALPGTDSVVKESSGTGVFVPQPFHARQLVLTPLGATFDFLGTWDPPGTMNGALTVSKWDHRARIRRDTEVAVEYRGFLAPLGVPAVMIKKTTREFKRDGKGESESYRAVLVQRYYIRVDQKVKEFPALHQSFDSRDWCFRQIKVTPDETPPLLPPESLAESEVAKLGRQAFWPMIPSNPQARSCSTGKLFEFTVEYGEQAFNVPLLFVDNQVVHTPALLKNVLNLYADEVAARKWELATNPSGEFGVAKALARMVKGDVEYLPDASSRNSRHVTRWFVLGFQLSHQKNAPDDPRVGDESVLAYDEERERRRQPPFYPRVSQALIESKLLAQLSGNAVARNNISYHPTFVETAFDRQNVGGVFARFVQQGAPMIFGANTSASGGAMCPTTTMVAIAREHGPIGGDEKSVYRLTPPTAGPAVLANPPSTDPVIKFMKGMSDPVEYFASALGDAKLLGCVRLVDVIKAVLQVTGTRVPRINQKEIFDGIIDLLKPVLLGASDGPVDQLRRLESKLSEDSTPPAVSARLLPPLRAAVDSLEQVRAELQQATPRPEVVAELLGSAYSQLRQFVGDARQLTENPVALLPPSVADKIGEVKAAYDELVRVRKALIRLPQALRSAFVEAIAEETRTLQRTIEATPEYHAALEWTSRIQAQLDALAQSIAENAWQRIGQALSGLDEPVLELRGWIEINAEALKVKVIEFAKPLRTAVREAMGQVSIALAGLQLLQADSRRLYQAAVQAKKFEPADRVLELMRSTHQARELLVAFIDFAKRIEQTDDNAVLSALSMTSECLKKAESMLRKTSEVVSLANESAALCRVAGTVSIASAPVDLQTQATLVLTKVESFVGSMHTVVKQIELSKSFKEFRLNVAVLLPAGTFKTSIEKHLRDAEKFAQKLELTAASMKAELELQKLELFEMVEKYLALLLTRVDAKGSTIVAAAERWRDRYVALQRRLHDVLKEGVLVPCSKLSGWPNVSMDAPLARPLVERLNSLAAKILALGGTCTTAIAAPEKLLDVLREASALADEAFALVAYVGEAVQGGNLGALVDQRAAVEEVLKLIGVPTKFRITYDWDTDIEEFPRGGGAIFRPVTGRDSTGPGGRPQLAIHSVTEVDLRNSTAPVTTVNGRVDAFDLHLFGAGPFLIVKLHPVTFVSGNRQALKLDVKVKDVEFGQALNFVNDLAQYIGAESGFYVQAASGLPGIEIGYRFNKDIIQLAALTLQSVSLSLAVILPFNNSPMRLRVAVGSRQKPVLASVGIYGAGFFVAMTLRADAMELMEFSLEYGGVTGVSFGGIATGTCKITAGVYIALGARDEISGFFSAVGALSIASLIKIGAALVVSISKAKDKMTGSAIFTFSFSIAIVDYSYSVGVSYTKDGDKDMSQDAEGKGPAQQDGARVALLGRLSANDEVLDEVYDASDPSGTSPSDYRVDMHEKRASRGTAPKLHPGLADSNVWHAYWGGFSDLSGVPVEMCSSPGAK